MILIAVKRMRLYTALACALLLLSSRAVQSDILPGVAPWVGQTFWNTPCIGKSEGYGPYDYTQRSQIPDRLRIVEVAHFTPSVEKLIAGNRSGTALGDLDYTLRAWPNHHRALNTAIRARLRNKDNYRTVEYPPAECYLQRAINFSPNDGVTRMLYGLLQHRMNRLEDALESYRAAEELDPDNVQIQYNLGLLFTDLGRYDDAAKYARQVYATGFPLPGLQRRLREKGYWQEPAD